ncbi:MAG: oligosaccharide flippase family protein [bacterium]|nr:oligosaccharide flippase family protein [bacterium]
MDETTADILTPDLVKKRTVVGIVALTSRNFVLQGIAFAATFFFTILLSKEQYGVVYLMFAVQGFMNYFADIGLAAALVQKKGDVTKKDLSTTFIVQHTLIIILLLVLVFNVSKIQQFFNLSGESQALLYAFAFAFFLSSLKTIPSVLLERKIQFEKLIIPQIAEVLIYNIVGVFLVWKGFGLLSFVYAIILSRVIGLILIYIIQPWFPTLQFSPQSFKELIRFGLPYQANTFIALIKDEGLTLGLAKILGAGPLGLFAWSKKWAEAPLRFFMDQVIKVTFPAYSRMQNDPKALSNALTRSIFFICLLVFPSLIGLVTVAPLLIRIIPRYGQWEPALIPMAIYAINILFAAFVTPITNFFNAIGEIKITSAFMVFWTALSWLLVPFLATKYGINGAAAGYALVGLSSVGVLVIASSFVKIDYLYAIIKPLFSAAVMGGVVYWLSLNVPVNAFGVILLILSGFITYLASIYLLVGPTVVTDLKTALANLKKR